MLILSKEDIKKLFSMKEAIQSSKEALKLYSAGKSLVPLRINIDIAKHQGQSLFMPAYVDELDMTGIKIVSIYPKNIESKIDSVSSKMVLLDSKTGRTCAMLNGTYLTQLRTGALQGAAIDMLANQDAKNAILIGTGGQAATALEAMLIARPLKEVSVFDINFARAALFVESMQKEFSEFNTKISHVTNINAAIKNSDIITTLTTSTTPVFEGELVKKGAHINGMGAFMPHMQELPASLIQRADKIFFDTKQGVLAEAGDIIIPMKAGKISESNFSGELGEVILQKIKGRKTEHEITVFKAVGTAVLDVVTAYHIYLKALSEKIGKKITI